MLISFCALNYSIAQVIPYSTESSFTIPEPNPYSLVTPQVLKENDIKMYISYGNGKANIISYLNEEGLLVKEEHLNTSFSVVLTKTYGYDDKQHIITEKLIPPTDPALLKQYFPNNSNPIEKTKEYNAEGNMVKMNISNYKIKQFTWNYSYDEGHPTVILSAKCFADKKLKISTSSIVDKVGNILSYSELPLNNGEATFTQYFTYDEENRLKTRQLHEIYADKVLKSDLEIYTYHKNGQLALIQIEDDKGNPIDKTKYEFDESGRLIKTTFWTIGSNMITPDGTRIRTYDVQGSFYHKHKYAENGLPIEVLTYSYRKKQDYIMSARKYFTSDEAELIKENYQYK
ncbi:MAG: hypothetical protein BM555_06780 [Crocinitomix sp. MedPE-SWsnd]|nr:MAG: hypothetical protein BM555_06780 [Crocinitomix sp. MedPE-SWsnd]